MDAYHVLWVVALGLVAPSEAVKVDVGREYYWFDGLDITTTVPTIVFGAQRSTPTYWYSNNIPVGSRFFKLGTEWSQGFNVSIDPDDCEARLVKGSDDLYEFKANISLPSYDKVRVQYGNYLQYAFLADTLEVWIRPAGYEDLPSFTTRKCIPTRCTDFTQLAVDCDTVYFISDAKPTLPEFDGANQTLNAPKGLAKQPNENTCVSSVAPLPRGGFVGLRLDASFNISSSKLSLLNGKAAPAQGSCAWNSSDIFDSLELEFNGAWVVLKNTQTLAWPPGLYWANYSSVRIIAIDKWFFVPEDVIVRIKLLKCDSNGWPCSHISTDTPTNEEVLIGDVLFDFNGASKKVTPVKRSDYCSFGCSLIDPTDPKTCDASQCASERPPSFCDDCGFVAHDCSTGVGKHACSTTAVGNTKCISIDSGSDFRCECPSWMRFGHKSKTCDPSEDDGTDTLRNIYGVNNVANFTCFNSNRLRYSLKNTDADRHCFLDLVENCDDSDHSIELSQASFVYDLEGNPELSHATFDLERISDACYSEAAPGAIKANILNCTKDEGRPSNYLCVLDTSSLVAGVH